MARIDEDVVGKVVVSETAYSSQEIFAHHESVFGFGLQDVAKVAQLGKTREMLQTLLDVLGEKIYPSHDSRDLRMLFGEVQQKESLLFRLIRLHGNTPIYAIRVQLRN